MILSLLKTYVPSKIQEAIFQIISMIISEQWDYGWYKFTFICIFTYPKFLKNMLSQKNNTRIFGQFFMFKPTTFNSPIKTSSSQGSTFRRES